MASKTGKKLFDIMIISDDGKIRKYRVSPKLIKAFIVLNIILVLLLVLSIFASIFLYGKIKKIEKSYSKQSLLVLELKNKNSRYQNSLDLYSKKINNIYTKIASIEYYSDKFLKNIGAKNKKIKKITLDKYPILENQIYDTYINFIDEKTDILEEKLLYSYSTYQKNESILLSTPSIWPVRGWLSSYFGEREDPFTKKKRFHDGIDIANNPGTPIKATANGVVTFSGENGGYGNVIIIKHNYQLETRYAHLQASIVVPKQKVKKGEVIGYLGNTGRSSGPHLHYEVRKYHIPINPMNYILE